MTNGTQSESALRNNKSGTISQQSQAQVQHQYSAHYTGGESSTNKRPQEMSALERLKCIQNNFRQQWHGINCEISGRPGESPFFLISTYPGMHLSLSLSGRTSLIWPCSRNVTLRACLKFEFPFFFPGVIAVRVRNGLLLFLV